MRSVGFNQSAADPCIYIRDGNSISVVAVYVDYLIIATKTVEEIETLKQLLQSQFKMKDMGELHSCLGITITHDQENGSIEMHQKQ